jgi:competence protein CoiA
MVFYGQPKDNRELMQYAVVNEIKTEPLKGLKGICIGCGKQVLAKCGQVKIHHWAHTSIKDCDTWSEPETEWHREWKNRFPAEFREVCFTDKRTGEIHRADVHTNKGVTLEFQNSPISLEELKSREEFYSNLIWIVNAKNFNIVFTGNIPNPDDRILKDFVMEGSLHVCYFKTKEIAAKTGDEDRLYSFGCPELKGLELSIKHCAFEWKNKHHGWLNTNMPTFLDLGDEFLYRLKERKQERSEFWYIEIVSKEKFISKFTVR